MKIKYLSKKLSTDENFVISNYDSTIELETDTENLFGILYLNDSLTKTIQFTKYNDTTKGRIILTNTNLKNATDCYFQICECNSVTPYYSNKIKVTLEVLKINSTIKADASEEIVKLKSKINQLEYDITALTNKQIFNTINCDLSYSKPGMVPVTIDCNGTFVLKKPFANAVETVNDIIPEGGNIKLTADDIKYTDSKTISESLELTTQAINALYTSLTTLSDEIKSLRQDLMDLQLKVEEYQSSPII